VADGTRTHDHLDHNQGLYQLSYSHRAQSQDSFGLDLAINADLRDASAGFAGARHPAPEMVEPRQIIMAPAQPGRICRGSAGVRLGGFEPPTRGLEGRRSVH
jgi:hypothetical protein